MGGMLVLKSFQRAKQLKKLFKSHIPGTHSWIFWHSRSGTRDTVLLKRLLDYSVESLIHLSLRLQWMKVLEQSTDRKWGKESGSQDTWGVDICHQDEERGAVPNIGPDSSSELREELHQHCSSRSTLSSSWEGVGKNCALYEIIKELR